MGFDTASETFLAETDIPGGAGTVRHLFYYEAAVEIWFGTDRNYIGGLQYVDISSIRHLRGMPSVQQARSQTSSASFSR